MILRSLWKLHIDWVTIVVWFITNLSLIECSADETTPASELLTREQWNRLNTSVDRGLKFLAANQKGDGSFASPATGQPGITSLCILAFLSRGHQPERGEYGAVIDRALDYVLRAQQKDGLIFAMPVEGKTWPDSRHITAMYNHAISGLMLTEIYGMIRSETSDRLDEAIKNAVKFTRAQQLKPKPHAYDLGGWRYVVMDSGAVNDSDMSVTGWQVMFLRSAKNAGFDVPVESIDSAMEYVRRAYDPGSGTFSYGHANLRPQVTRGMVGSGILTLSMGGEHQTEMAQSAGKWLLKHPFHRYNGIEQRSERYHYSVYYCSQAMFQLGGDYWKRFYPPLMTVLTDNQQADGSWQRESNKDGHFGNVYTSALVILALNPAYQLLPIYQR